MGFDSGLVSAEYFSFSSGTTSILSEREATLGDYFVVRAFSELGTEALRRQNTPLFGEWDMASQSHLLKCKLEELPPVLEEVHVRSEGVRESVGWTVQSAPDRRPAVS